MTVSGNPPLVVARTLATCVGGSFGAGAALGANYPVGLNNGLPLTGGAFADVIELSVPRVQLIGAEPQMRFGIGAVSASGSIDVLYTANGQVGGQPMVVGLPASIPTIGFFGALLLALALATLALRALRHNRKLAQMLLVGAFLSVGLAAWAANFIADGQVGDWAGSSPAGMDAIGDSVPNLSATDIVGAFAAESNRSLFFRIDVVDAENRPPVAVGDAYTTLEDTTLTVAAPGVLGNDSDPDGNPITAQLLSGPTRGTLVLNANGSFSYTPDANTNGSDSFTYNAFDGQVTSLSPATVTIAITPVNDVPVFIVGPNQTVLEDAGPQTVNPWATAIDDGDPEVTQNLSFEIAANSNAALFSVAPTVSPTGALSYTPAANANGSATITLRLNDDGGTANGGVNQSATQTFTITVTAVNDAPGFTAGPNQTVDEDAGPQTINPWATAISAGPPDESGQAISFEVTGNSNAALFSVAPAVSATGVLSYTPAANANGAATITLRARDDGGTANGGVDASPAQTFTITVNAVNDAPSFTVGPNQTVNEDAGPQTVNPWATALNDGDPELTQALSFVITANSNAALFSTAPAVSPTGVLTYTPAANANGSATITLRIQDDGSSTPPNVNTSATQTFTITVNAVNDAPTLTAVSPPTVNEDAGAQTVANWAAFNPGPPDESGQTVLGYQISAISNAALFAVPPAVANNGTLTYTPAANANGSSTFVARVQDSGGTANGGVDLSIAQTFTITVNAVNDVPSFTVGPNQTVLEDAGPQTVSPWATAINDGDPEVTQVLAFTITGNSNAALFSAAPSVSPTGVLSYTPAANANGSATITLRLQDDGSNTPPNVNTSATQTFTITVTPVNDAPGFTAGANQTVNEDATAQTVNPWATAISAGPADESGQTLSFNVTGNSNAALFSAQPVISPTGVLTYTPAANANGVATITLTLSDNGSNTPPNVNTSAAQTFTITVNAVNDAPVNTVPGAQTTGDSVPLVLSTANTNALGVADVDAAAGIVQMSFGTGAAANGTLTLANPGSVLTSLTGNGTQQVIATGTLTALNLALNGPGGSLTYTPEAGTTAARTITVITNDQGNTGAGGAQIDTDLVTVNVDAPPVVTSNPASGATIANNAAIVVNFSEQVTVTSGITLSCGGPNLITGGATGAGVNTLNLTYTAPLPAGSCTLTVPDTSVADDDGIDPPQNPLTTYSATFTVDAAPRVTTTTPAAGATTANNIGLQINFSEAVSATNAVTLTCTLGAVPLAGTSGTGVSALNPTYAGALPPGLCTLTVVAANINDTDVVDPPAQLDGDGNGVEGDNFVITFTVDDAPAFVSATPGAAAVVGTGQTISFTYNENVTDLGGAITLSCNAVNVPGSIVAAGATLTFTPSSQLTPGQSCTATAVASQIGDADSFDPPQNPVVNQTLNFSVDAAPDFSSSVPANNAINVGLDSNLSVTFSEAVNFTTSAFTLDCPAGSAVPFTVSGSGSNTAIIDPTPATLPINTECVLTVDDAQVTDVDLADPPNAGSGITTISFTTVNDNPPAVTTNPSNGATNIALNSNITVNFNEPVTLAGAWFQLNCPISGVRTSTGELTGTGINIIENTPDLVYTIDPSADLANGEACTITIDSANAVDNDAIDPPNELDGDASGDTTDGDADDYVAQFTTPDIAPTVTSTPAAGAGVPNTQTVTLNFSEQVNVAAGAISFNCGSAVPFTPALPQSGISTLTLTPGAALPNGASCTVTLESTLITDVDAIDPPNQLDGNSSGDLIDGDADDFALTFTVDAPPAVTSAEVEVVNVYTSLPLGGGVFADSDTNLRLSFSEAVNPTANWASLTCSNSGTQSVGGGTLAVTNADPVFTLNPATNLTPGESCTLTVFAAQVEDDDAIDPPGNLAADASYTFSVRDAAPRVLTPTVPLNAATVPDTQLVTLNFSEVVDLAAGSVLFDCGGAVAFTPALPQNNVSSITLTPSAALPAGAACTVTQESTLVTDDDALDPPNQLDGDSSNDTTDGDADDFVLSFNVDAAPGVLATTPANGATNVPPTSAISIDFSESVSFSTLAEPAPGNPSFDLVCDGSPAGFSVTSASPNDPVVLNPVDSEVAGRSCVLTVVAAQIADSDAIDPPNNMAANFSATIGFGAIANDDAYTVTPHLTLNIPTTGVQGGGTAANDILGAGAVTGFGFAPACTGTAAGAQLDAGAANGRLTLNANGSFAYEPPAGLNALTRTFCYTVTGGDTANIVFTVQNQARVWFVDASAAAGGNGTQARPFNALTGAGSFDAVAADGNGDTIYIEGAQTGGLTLRSGQRVIGGGSTVNIATFSGVAPIAGSAFPAVSGSAPVITCSGVNCLTLNNSGVANTHSLRGFTIGDSGATGTDIGGTTFGTLTVAELTLTGSGTTMSLATGTLNGTLLDLNANAGSGSLTLSAVGGTWSVANQVDLTGNLGAFSITDTPAGGSVTLTGGLNSALGNGTIVLTNNASPVNLGNILLNTTGSMTVSNSSGVTTVTNGSITTPFNSLLVTNSALNITLSTMTSTGGAGPGLSATNFTGSINIASGAITNSNAGFSQVVLNNNAGSFSFGGSVAKSTAGRLIDISGGTGNIDFSGTLTCQTSCGTGAGNEGLRVTGRSGGTVNFSGGTKGFSSTAANPAISLTNNSGSTINFSSGGLTITTTSGTGFSSTGGGVVGVTGTGNSIASTTGTALNVANTTIGAAGLNFRSVSSGGAANVGISLVNTGTSGGLTVTGTGAAGSGGTIANKTGADASTTAGIGIYLQDTSAVSLSWMQLNDFENFAIRGFRVSGFQLSNSVINSLASGTSRNGNSDVHNEGSVAFGEEDGVPTSGSPAINGLVGTVVINASVIEDGFENNFKISNTSGTLGPFTMTATTIRNNSTASPGNNGLEFRYAGTAGLDATITGSTFSANRANAIQFSSLESFTGTVNLQIGVESTLGSGSTFTDNNIGVNIANGGSGSVNFGVHRSTFTSAGYSGIFGGTGASSPININMALPSAPSLAGGPMAGALTQNIINNSDSTTGPGIRIVANGTDSDGSNVLTARVANNNITQVANRGIEVLTRDGNATINATIRDNSVQLANPLAADAIFVVAGATSTAAGTGLPDSGTINLDAANNDANSAGGFGIRVRQRFSSTYRLEQYAGPAASDADVTAYLSARNPLSAGIFADHTAAGSAGYLTIVAVPEP